MSISFGWRDTLIDHVEESWLELLELTAACIEENLVNVHLLNFELTSLEETIGEAKGSGDHAQLEGCLSRCKELFGYYRALRKQRHRVEARGSFA